MAKTESFKKEREVKRVRKNEKKRMRKIIKSEKKE